MDNDTDKKWWNGLTPEERAELIELAQKIMERAKAIHEALRTGDKERLKELGLKNVKVNLNESDSE